MAGRRGRAAAVAAARVQRRRLADPLGRLRDQRLRRPLARSAGRAHPRPAAGDRRGVAGARRWWLFAALMLVAFALVLTLNRLTDLPERRRRAAGGQLSLPQALHLPAAGVPGHGVRLGHPDGVRRGAAARCRRWPGCCTSPTSCGRPATTPGTRWSTATTTCAWARSRPRSCSATWTWSRRACCTRLSSRRWRWSASARSWACTTGAASASRWLLVAATNSSIARDRDRDACFRAFLHNHWVGAAVFAGHRAGAARCGAPALTARLHGDSRHPRAHPRIDPRARRRAAARAPRHAGSRRWSSRRRPARHARAARAAPARANASRRLRRRAARSSSDCARGRADAPQRAVEQRQAAARAPAGAPVPAPGRSRACAGGCDAAAPAPAPAAASQPARTPRPSAAPAGAPAARSRWNLKRGSSRSTGNA